MKRLIFAWIIFVASAVGLQAQTPGAFNGVCQSGGVTVTTQGMNSSNYVQASYPKCIVTVYLTGTLTQATIYSNASGTPLTNGFTANTDGSWLFYAATGVGYDVMMTGGTPIPLPATKTLTDLIVGGGGGGGSNPFPSELGVICNTSISASVVCSSSALQTAIGTSIYDSYGSATAAQSNAEAAFSGDVQKAANSFATTVIKVNGAALPVNATFVGTNSSGQIVNGPTIITPALGGTGLSSSSSTGVAQVSAGTWTFSSALANGTTATTQTLGDTSTHIATDGFVAAAVAAAGGGTVMTFSAPAANWPTWLVPTVTNASTAPSLTVAASAIPNGALANAGTTVNGQSCVLGTTCTVPAVTAVSIATANGISGSSSGGNTPALTLSLGAINPTSVGATTPGTGAFSTLTANGNNVCQSTGTNCPIYQTTVYAGNGTWPPGCTVDQAFGTPSGVANNATLIIQVQEPLVSGFSGGALHQFAASTATGDFRDYLCNSSATSIVITNPQPETWTYISP